MFRSRCVLCAGARETPEQDDEEEALSSRAKRFALLNPMPNTNKELAILIRDVIGARPKYGDESARPTCWPADVPWLKGKSISQVRGVSGRLRRNIIPCWCLLFFCETRKVQHA